MSYHKSRFHQSAFTAYTAIIGAAVIWGLTVPIMKLTLQNIPVFSLAFIRFTCAALILLPFVYKKLRIKTKDIFFIILIGLLGITFNILPFFYGLKLTSALNAGILMSTTPLITFVAAHIFLKEKVRSKTVLGALIGFAGILMVMFDNTAPSFSVSPQGDLLILASTFAFVAYEITSKKVLKKYSFLVINFYSFAVGALSFLPFTIKEMQTNSSWIIHLSRPTIFGILFGIFFSSLLGYSLWQWGLSRLEASRAGVLMYLDPVVVTIASVVILSETLTPLFLLGAASIFLGLIIAGQKIHPLHKILKQHENL